MNDRHVRAVLRREWRELTRNKLTLMTVAFVPAALVTVGLVGSGTVGHVSEQDAGSAHGLTGGMDALAQTIGTKNAIQALMNEQLLTMLLLVAAVLPATIAAHAIIGEKVERTLEPVLATPIRTGDLLLGKCLAAVLPAWVITFAAYAIFATGMAFLSAPPVFAMTVRVAWPLAFLVISPLISTASALMTLMLSSRVNDPRTAQGLAGVLVVPVIGTGMSALFGVISINVITIAIGALGFIVLDAILLAISVRLFARETILTRWK